MTQTNKIGGYGSYQLKKSKKLCCNKKEMSLNTEYLYRVGLLFYCSTYIVFKHQITKYGYKL